MKHCVTDNNTNYFKMALSLRYLNNIAVYTYPRKKTNTNYNL